MRKRGKVLETIILAALVPVISSLIPSYMLPVEAAVRFYPLLSSLILIFGGLGLRRFLLSEKKVASRQFKSPYWLLLPSLLLVNAGISSLMGIYFPESVSEYGSLLRNLQQQPLWLLVLTSCITVPLGEELLFRYFVCRRLSENGVNRRYVIFISALFFSILHFRIFQMAVAFIPGIILGWLFLDSRSLFFPFILHGLQNAFSLFLSYKGGEAMNLPAYCLWSSFVVGIVLFFLCLLLVEKKMHYSSSHSSSSKGKETSSENSSPLS